MSLTEQIITIVMCVIGTVMPRSLAFLLFKPGKNMPAYIRYLGRHSRRYFCHAGGLLPQKCQLCQWILRNSGDDRTDGYDGNPPVEAQYDAFHGGGNSHLYASGSGGVYRLIPGRPDSVFIWQ